MRRINKINRIIFINRIKFHFPNCNECICQAQLFTDPLLKKKKRKIYAYIYNKIYNKTFCAPFLYAT